MFNRPYQVTERPPAPDQIRAAHDKAATIVPEEEPRLALAASLRQKLWPDPSGQGQLAVTLDIHEFLDVLDALER